MYHYFVIAFIANSVSLGLLWMNLGTRTGFILLSDINRSAAQQRLGTADLKLKPAHEAVQKNKEAFSSRLCLKLLWWASLAQRSKWWAMNGQSWGRDGLGLPVRLIVFSLVPSLGASTPLPGHCDSSTHSCSASPWVGGKKGACSAVCEPLHICVYMRVGQCVLIKRNASRWRPPITKESTTSLFLLHAASSYIALIAMATGALSLGSACIQSEWDLCRDSSGLHLFNLPHRNSLRTEKAGTKRGETPSPELGMT